jgi:serine/threonine protein kinase
VDIDDPTERWAYLEDSCRGNAELRQRVEALIRSHKQADDFLNVPPPGIEVTDFHPVVEVPGELIGPYKLLEQIGEGGFGVVFLAEQEQPVRRKIALKIIKPGMDTRRVVARFEAERQALALMDHPNIAKVHDAGTTEKGRPYFVMELVQGVPITEYCVQCNLTTRERLELFIAVCQAVQHAHQKGVIHRDIKPTNVLVAMQDGQPAPKIIDFGVAKAIEQRLTEHTLTTGFAQMIGSPLYMSPEQAELSPLGVDTRSDVYSLGVLLYELLAGTTPFDKDRLHAASYDEMRRIIREEEPPHPSSRLSTLAAALSTTIAERRRTDARRLNQQVCGELDWVVMKCLEKDRNRRYETASALAEDIGRYLADQPVQARRPTRAYRVKKFVRRNKLGILVGSMMVAAISIGMAATIYFAASASREAKHATAALARAELNEAKAQGINTFFAEEVFSLADPNRSNHAGISLLEALDIAAGKIDAKFPNDPVFRAEILDRLGGIYVAIDKPNKAVPQLQHAARLRKSFAGDKDPATLKSRFLLGWALHRGGRWEEARDVLQSVMDEQTSVLGAGNPDTLETTNEFVILLTELRGFGVEARAEDRDLEIAQSAYDAALVTLGPRHFATLRAENSLSLVLRWRNRVADALPYARAAALGLTEVAGRENPETMFAIYDYSLCLEWLQRYDQAVTELKPLVAVRNRVLGPLHFDTLFASWRLAESLRSSGDSAQSLAVLEDVYAHLLQSAELPNWRRVLPILNIANAYLAVGRDDRAAELCSLVDKILSSMPRDEAAPAARAEGLHLLAQMLITSASAKIRNVDRGIQRASEACELTNFKKPRFVRTLVRAYLEKGDLDCSTGLKEAEAAFRRAMELYDAHAADFTGSDFRIDYAHFAYFLCATDRQVEAAEFVGRAAVDAKRLTDHAELANAHYGVALVQLRLGDKAAYRVTCRALADVPLQNADDVAKSRPIWTPCLAPDALDLEDVNSLTQRAEEFVAHNSLGQPHFGLSSLGAALYRSGEYERAAQVLEESIVAYPADPPRGFDMINIQRLFLAMSKWQLGRRDEASQLLAETLPAIDKELQSPSSAWNRRATLEILRRESEALIGKEQAEETRNTEKTDTHVSSYRQPTMGN